jgi:PIN domain nuclease of toxin-antitoxin system
VGALKKLLLDTHTFLWWLDGDERLSKRARELIGDASVSVLVSAASAWEISTKFRLGKLPGAAAVAADIAGCIAAQGFEALHIGVDHAQRAGALPGPHRDPFDRMLAAQAQAENLPIVSTDSVFDEFGLQRIW